MRNDRQVRNRRSERGVVLLVTICSLLVIIPMVGLTVDVGYLYASKARLQAATDGAALAAARALSLGATTAAQADAAKQNAVNWFYADFPVGSWASRSTVMNVNTVTVTTPSPSLSTVSVSASTRVPTYFMKWLNIDSTPISSVGTANRRTVVVMMVLDRSASMNTSSSCGTLLAAAKLFTGQFAAGRDYIGMVSFSDGVGPVYPPTTNFRATLGYNDGTTTGNGMIDQIVCEGGTGTAAAMTVGYNELYKMSLPGAYNVLLVETDGLPNSLAFDFWDASAGAPADPNKSMFATQSSANAGQGCLDLHSPAKTRTQTVGTPAVAGWGSSTYRRDFYLPRAGSTGSMAFGGFLGTIGPGTIGTIYSNDPGGGNGFQSLMTPWQPNQASGITVTSTQPNNTYYETSGNGNVSGCKFATSVGDIGDFKYLPRTDLFGNDVLPANNYLPVTLVNPNPTGAITSTTQNNTTSPGTRYMKFVSGMTNPSPWTNFHNAALNATDHAMFRARAGWNGNIPATTFVIGLGGNTTNPSAIPDFHLMQRWANDPLCDQFTQPINPATGCGPTYTAYTMPSTFNTQPQGTLVFSSNANDLRSAFLRISSQILRLSR